MRILRENPCASSVVPTHVVVGILPTIPRNSHIQFDFLLNIQNFIATDKTPQNWNRFQVYTYIQLDKSASSNGVEKKITEMASNQMGVSGRSLFLQNLVDIHLYGLFGGGRIRFVYLFSLISIFVILIAAINFTNLTTARSARRLKEVGVRKIMGARRTTLVHQFLMEANILSAIALVLALLLVGLFLPSFNDLTKKTMSLGSLFTPFHLLLMLSVTLLIGCLAGIYPAILLTTSRYKFLSGGKGLGSGAGKRRPIFRRGLVVFQFTVASILIIATLIVSDQVEFIFNKDLGYNPQRTLMVHLVNDGNPYNTSLKDELLRLSGIQAITAVSEPVTRIGREYNGIQWEGRVDDQDIPFRLLSVDSDFFNTLGIHLVQGRGFTSRAPSDSSTSYILNETAVSAMGLSSPVGSWMEFTEKGFITGVAKDFHFQSLHDEVEPLLIINSPERYRYLMLKLKPDPVEPVPLMKDIQAVWTRFYPQAPFQSRFLEDDLGLDYEAEVRTQILLADFGMIAVITALMGLLSLAALLAEHRTKELAIRKVMGASALQMHCQFAKQFMIMVTLAFIIACPLVLLTMDLWLTQFAYRTTITIQPFVLTGLGVIIITQIAISLQAARIIRRNPVRALRFE